MIRPRTDDLIPETIAEAVDLLYGVVIDGLKSAVRNVRILSSPGADLTREQRRKIRRLLRTKHAGGAQKIILGSLR